MKKKLLTLFTVIVLLLPLVAFKAHTSVETKPTAGTYCYEVTVSRYFKNTSSTPKSITYQEGNHAGTLYLVSTKSENYQITATYQGSICNSGQASRILLD